MIETTREDTSPEVIREGFWKTWYTDKVDHRSKPSDFAIFIADNYFQKNQNQNIIELGCGKGRDSSFFANLGHKVIGVDLAATPPETDEKWRFLQADMGAMKNLKYLEDEQFDAVYFRFCLHSVDDDVQKRALEWAKSKLNENGLICIEARSIHDPLFGKGEKVGRNAFLGKSLHSPPHYRRFLVFDELVGELEGLGFEVLFSGEQNGWAVYQGEDPVVVRVVAKRNCGGIKN